VGAVEINRAQRSSRRQSRTRRSSAEAPSNLIADVHNPGSAGSFVCSASEPSATLERTMDDLSSRGVRFEHYDQPGIKTDERGVFDGGDFRAAWIKDTDGNTMAITQFSSYTRQSGQRRLQRSYAAPLDRTLRA
jgi:hypothetical protein